MFNLVSRDLQSVTAKNIKLIKELADTDILTVGSHNVKEALHEKQAVNIPAQDGWKGVAGGQVQCEGGPSKIPTEPY